MNLFSQTKQITRIDYYGAEYTATIVDDHQPDLSTLWRNFTRMSAANHRSLGPGYVDTGNRLSEHGERVLKEKEG